MRNFVIPLLGSLILVANVSAKPLSEYVGYGTSRQEAANAANLTDEIGGQTRTIRKWWKWRPLSEPEYFSTRKFGPLAGPRARIESRFRSILNQPGHRDRLRRVPYHRIVE